MTNRISPRRFWDAKLADAKSKAAGIPARAVTHHLPASAAKRLACACEAARQPRLACEATFIRVASVPIAVGQRCAAACGTKGRRMQLVRKTEFQGENTVEVLAGNKRAGIATTPSKQGFGAVARKMPAKQGFGAVARKMPAKQGFGAVAQKIPSRQGFTYTVSALMIALTLISMAYFSSQWRASQQLSYNEVLPSDSFWLASKVSGDLRSLTGAYAEIIKTGNSTADVLVSVSFPLEKEGADAVDISQYPARLASTLRGSGVEASLYSGMSGSSSTVIFLPDSGSLSLQNSLGSDVAAITHPLGWQASRFNMTLYINKRVALLSNITVQNGGGTAIPYSITIREQDGRTFVRSASACPACNATLTAFFDDGSTLAVRSSLSASSNSTSINYTKSPGAYLVLPFDSNSTLSLGGVADYSVFQNNLSLGGGSSANAPAWSVSCKSGSCFLFDGSNDFLNGTLPNFTQAGDVPGSQNFGFESYYNLSG